MPTATTGSVRAWWWVHSGTQEERDFCFRGAFVQGRCRKDRQYKIPTKFVPKKFNSCGIGLFLYHKHMNSSFVLVERFEYTKLCIKIKGGFYEEK